jgi:hypothetical protein
MHSLVDSVNFMKLCFLHLYVIYVKSEIQTSYAEISICICVDLCFKKEWIQLLNLLA